MCIRDRGTLTLVFPGDLTVKLLDVTHVPDIAFKLSPLMAAHKQGVRFTTKEEILCIYLFDGRLRFEGDGSTEVTLDSLAEWSQTTAMHRSSFDP